MNVFSIFGSVILIDNPAKKPKNKIRKMISSRVRPYARIM